MKKLIGIIGGNGKMGKYFTDFFEKNGYSVIVSDKGTKLSNIQLAKEADVVIVSVPIGLTEKVIEEVAPYVKKSGLLMDLTSLKVFPMKAMSITKASYLGCHPMFGPTNSIEGQLTVLCKGRGSKWYKWWKDLLQKNHVDVRELSAKKHDHLMAYIQSLTHFNYLVFADALRGSGFKISDFLRYQSPIYRLRLDMMGRILNQDPNLYAEIQIQNPESPKVMKEYLKLVDQWIDLVEKKDVKAFEKRFKDSSRYVGELKKIAMEESDFVIEQLSRKKLLEDEHLDKIKPDKSYHLATLGPENTFSSLAAKKYMPKAKIWHTKTITEVFNLVGKGVIEKGIVPIENKLTGTVIETFDNLFESNLKIQDSFELPIHHFLVALSNVDKKKIKTIYSHSQPLRQCRNYLSKHFPKASFVAMPSTATSLKKVASENLYNTAVICSQEASEAFRMTVLDKNIEDYKFNSTRFLIVGKKALAIKRKVSYLTSIAFHFSADEPGTLHQVLGEFSACGVNMTKIESHANPTIPGGYVFYIDFEGSVEDSKVKKMLPRLRKHVSKIKIFGSY